MASRFHSFNASDADVALVSSEECDPTEFHVHRCILMAASPFFYDMFSLPQNPAETKRVPRIPVSESRQTLNDLLRLVYPIQDPPFEFLDDLTPVLAAALKYDLLRAIETLRNLLVSHRFVRAEPLRVYAIATRFDLEEEARIASQYTLTINIIDAPLSDDLKFITAHSYHRLLELHRRRVRECVEMVRIPPGDIKCMQCNGTAFSAHAIPRWWPQFEKRAREELSVRPTTEVIFGMEFLAQAAMAAECPRCASSILDAWKSLEELKRRMDELPATIL